MEGNDHTSQVGCTWAVEAMFVAHLDTGASEKSQAQVREGVDLGLGTLLPSAWVLIFLTTCFPVAMSQFLNVSICNGENACSPAKGEGDEGEDRTLVTDIHISSSALR